MTRRRFAARGTAIVLAVVCVILPTQIAAQSRVTGPVAEGAGARAVASAPAALAPGPLALSASREAVRLGRVAGQRARDAQSTQAPSQRCWLCRHLVAFVALVGFGSGCALGASQVGGSDDNVYNTLDELACPVVGAIGAGAGALIGWAVSHVK